MKELTHILNDKFIELSRKIASHDLPYNDDYKTRVLYEISEIVHDTCIARGYTYDLLRFDPDTALFEVKDMLYGLVITVLFRNRDVKVFFNPY